MHSQPKLSIIIPIYKVEDYLEQCLDSIVSQPLRELEIICVNDGSPDNCLAILKEYAQADDRIVVIDQPNQGASAARNNGIKASTGEYTLFVDPDDWVVIDSLLPLYEKISRTPADFAFFNYTSWNTKTHAEKKNLNRLYVLTMHADMLCTPSELTPALLDLSAPIWSMIFKTEFIQKNNLFFSDLRLSEGFIYYLQAFGAAKQILCLTDKVYIHRTGNNSSTTSNIDNTFTDLIHAFYEAERILKNAGLYNPIRSVLVQNRIDLFSKWDKRVSLGYKLAYYREVRKFISYIVENYEKPFTSKLKIPAKFKKNYLLRKFFFIDKKKAEYAIGLFSFRFRIPRKKTENIVKKSKKPKQPTLVYRQNQYGSIIISDTFYALKNTSFVNQYVAMFNRVPNFFAVDFRPEMPLYQEHLKRLKKTNEICWRYTKRFGAVQKTTVYLNAAGEIRFKRKVLNAKGYAETDDLIVYAEPDRGLIKGTMLRTRLRKIPDLETLQSELVRFADFLFARFTQPGSDLLDPTAFDACPHNCIVRRDGSYVFFDLEFKFKGGLDRSYALWRTAFYTVREPFSPVSLYEYLCDHYGLTPDWTRWKNIDASNHVGLWQNARTSEEKAVFDTYFLKKTAI